MDKARQLFGKALELDPGLARAYVGLAWICELEIGLGYTASVAQSRASKLAHAQKAVDLDSRDGEAHAALATYYADEGDFDRATDEFGRAEALAPNNADILLFHGSYLPQLGKPALAAEKVGLAVRLNPNYPPWYNRGLRSAYYFAGSFDRALAAARAAGLSAANDDAWLAVAAAQLGRTDEAQRAAGKVLALDPDWSAERRMSDFGKFARETEPLLFADGARKSGLPVFATAAQRLRWPEMTPLPDCE
jgi:Tfp pilus assembly protein PilF